MSRLANQTRILLQLLEELRPHWGRDRELPARIRRRLGGDRSFGSKDRRSYRELLFTTLRYLPWIEPLLDRAPQEAVARIVWLSTDLPTGSPLLDAIPVDWPAPPPGATARGILLGEDPAGLLPPWIEEECPEALDPTELDALLARAPLWIRLQRGTLATLAATLGEEGFTLRPAPPLPSAARVTGAGDLTTTPSFREGVFEVQDLGSQLLLEMVELAPSERWLDACAGAGGKTLQLAGRLPSGGVSAYDPRSAALEELRLRAERSGFADRIQVLDAPASGEFDGVLVDAPCSGSGTWRRSPHLKWCTPREELERQAARQRTLLEGLADRVRPGGILLYTTCSLARREGEGVVRDFLTMRDDFEVEPPPRGYGAIETPWGVRLLPALHDTDGFTLALLRRAPR